MKSQTILIAILMVLSGVTSAFSSEYYKAWRDRKRALVIDAYEFNEINWDKMLTDKRIAAFISKATDGLPPRYGCKGSKKSIQYKYCKVAWRKYSVTKELYRTRRSIAKRHGLKWGAYHLGRPGNPRRQADHFLEFARPTADDMIVLDLETRDTSKYMSFAEAEKFAERIFERTGRFPILYANGDITKWIVHDIKKYPLLSRLKLWYARYKSDIRTSFPKGNWNTYLMWQFAYGGNCNKVSCPYRVAGAPDNIDVNVANMTVEQLKQAWPFPGLLPVRKRPRPIEVLEVKAEGNQSSTIVTDLDPDSDIEPESIVPTPRVEALEDNQPSIKEAERKEAQEEQKKIQLASTREPKDAKTATQNNALKLPQTSAPKPIKNPLANNTPATSSVLLQRSQILPDLIFRCHLDEDTVSKTSKECTVGSDDGDRSSG